NQAMTVITGSTGALGRGVVERLSSRGQRVLAVDRPGSDAALAELAKGHDNVRGVALDVLSVSAWQSALAERERELGTPTGAVLIAGGWQGTAFGDAKSDAVWRAMFDANLETARASITALLPSLRTTRGSVVVIGSRAAVRPWESAGAAAYAASKAALLGL